MPDPTIFHFPRPSRFADVLRSQIRAPLIQLEAVRNVLARYGLRLIGQPVNLPLSRRTSNVIVNTSAGKKVLKKYRPLLQPEGIAFCHSILTRLAELNFPAPRLRIAFSGEDFVAHENSHYALFDYIYGKDYSLDFMRRVDRLRLLKIAGEILAQFHQSLNGFVPDGHHHWGFASYTGGWQRDMKWYAAKMEELKDKSSGIPNQRDREHSAWLIEGSSAIYDSLAQLDGVLLQCQILRLIIHNDFGLHNLLFQKNGMVALTDFETARIEWRLTDLASTLSRLRDSDNSYDFEAMRYFLQGYLDIFPVPEDEWQYFPDVWRYCKLRTVFSNWNSSFDSGDVSGKMISARDAFRQADWALRHCGQLLALGRA